MKNEKVNIEWNYQGKPDGLMGTGATSTEKLLGWSSAVFFTAVLFYAQIGRSEISWQIWHWILFAIIVFDVAGGVTANTLNSCKRLYFSPINEADIGSVRWAKRHWLFVGIHLHPILVEVIFPGGNIMLGVSWYVILLISFAVVTITPLYLKRPTAFAIIVLAIIGAIYFAPSAVGFEWFIPLLFLKIVYGHAVREEPYRP